MTLGAQGDVDPAGELVLKVPGRLAVTDENEGRLIGRLTNGGELPRDSGLARGNRKGVSGSGKHVDLNVWGDNIPAIE